MTREEIRLNLGALAEALPEGSAVPVPREWLLTLLGNGTAPANPEPLLTVDQAAARLNLKKSYLYKRAKDLPFTISLSRKELRFDPVGLASWLADRPKVSPRPKVAA